MTSNSPYLTDGKVDQRKVRKIALLRARHDRDIDVLNDAGVKVPRGLPFSEVMVWRRRTARPLMMAGARAGDTTVYTGQLFHRYFMDALETAKLAESKRVGHG